MDPLMVELVHEVFAPLGIGGILAGAMFWIYRRDAHLWQARWQDQVQMEKARTDREAARADALTTLVRDHTAITSELVTVIRERLPRS